MLFVVGNFSMLAKEKLGLYSKYGAGKRWDGGLAWEPGAYG